VNFGCIHCSRYQNDICDGHEKSHIHLHCVDCSDLYHAMMVDFSLEIDESTLCFECKNTMHVWRCFGPMITVKCFPCAWDGLQTNWPYNGDVESRAVCSIEATERASGKEVFCGRCSFIQMELSCILFIYYDSTNESKSRK